MFNKILAKVKSLFTKRKQETIYTMADITKACDDITESLERMKRKESE